MILLNKKTNLSKKRTESFLLLNGSVYFNIYDKIIASRDFCEQFFSVDANDLSLELIHINYSNLPTLTIF